MNIIHYSGNELLALESRYRTAFINSLGGFKSVVMVGTINGAHQTNLAAFSSLFHIGASPPLCGLIFRPDTAARHTLENIMEMGVYTINHMTEASYKQGHQTAARYDRADSEFEMTGLETQFSADMIAPYVASSVVKFGMQFKQRIDLTINGTILIIGQIVETFIPESCISEDGFVDLEQAGTVTLSGLDCYHLTTRLSRLTYPKPGIPVAEVVVK